MGEWRGLAAIGAALLLLAACGGQSGPTTAEPSGKTAAAPATSAPEAETVQKPLTLEELAAEVRSGVIRIEASGCNGEGVGSGLLIGSRLVATVEHVVAGASRIDLKREGKILATATVIGQDVARDIALLRTSKPIRGYAFELDARTPRLGESVVALGFPLGLPLSITRGVVSGTDRTIEIDGFKRARLIQTDASLNPGNSGGPLLDPETGLVLGLVDIGSDFNGLSFAVSSEVAAPLLKAWEVAPQPEAVSSGCAPTGEDDELAAPPPAEEEPPQPSEDESDVETARQEIEALLYDFHNAVVTGNYSAAWDLLSARKQQQTLREHGYDKWAGAQASFAKYLDHSGIHVEILDYDDTEQVATVMVSGMPYSAPRARCDEWSGITWVRNEDGYWQYDPGYSTTPERKAAWKSRYEELLGGAC